MFVYFKYSLFVILYCLTNWPIAIKAIDVTLREKEPLLPQLYSSIQENRKTINFRKKIDKLAEEFENFESLSKQEQQCLLHKWDYKTIKEWVIQAKLGRLGMMEEPLVVSDETWEKLRGVQKLYPKEKSHCVIF